MKNLIDLDKVKQVRLFQNNQYIYFENFRFEFFKEDGVLVLRMPVANVVNASIEKCTLQRVIARFFKNMNEKRQAIIHRRTLLSVTTCSNCGSRLTRCRCGQRKFQIEILDRALNGL